MLGRHTCIDVFKEEVAWATDKQPWVISNIMIVIALGNKNKVILNLN